MLSVEDERRAVNETVQRLTVRFPHVPADTVSEVVNTAHAKFLGDPIRDFVPVLVERAAREQLSAQSPVDNHAHP